MARGVQRKAEEAQKRQLVIRIAAENPDLSARDVAERAGVARNTAGRWITESRKERKG